MKKCLSAILASVLSVSLLISCGTPAPAETTSAAQENTANAGGATESKADKTNTEETAKEASSSGEEVTIEVLCAYASEDPHGQYVYQYADKYMEANPNVKVVVTAISSNDIYTKLAAMATSPDDLPTLFFTSVDQAPQLYDIGIIEDVRNYLDEASLAAYAPGVLDASTLDDTLAFFPIDVQPSAVIYRKDLFDAEGLKVPTTWDEFLTNAKALTKDTDEDGETDQWGFSMVGSNNSSGQSRFMSYLWSNGYTIVGKDGAGNWQAEIDDPKFLDTFSFWTNLNNVEGVVPVGITEVDYATAANYFAMGYTSMILSGSNALGVSYANNPDLKGKLGSFVIPGTAPGTMLNAEGYAISKFASEEEKKAAVDYLKFFLENDSELMFWQTSGKIPATIEGQKADYITGDDYSGYLETVAKGCIPPINFPGMNGLKGILGDAYSAVFSGEKSNEQAVEDLKTDFEALLEEYN